MNVQSERLASLCEELKLPSIAEQYGPIAQEAARKGLSFTDLRPSHHAIERFIGEGNCGAAQIRRLNNCDCGDG